jgi:hypothetical protein
MSKYMPGEDFSFDAEAQIERSISIVCDLQYP